MSQRPKLIFLLSLPRSGSTLLQRILASHPEIETTSELWFLLPFVYTLKDSGVYAQYSHVSLSNAMPDLLEKLPNGKQDYFDALKLFAETIYAKLSLQNSKYFLDKTPRYYLIIEELDKIFPEAKFIFLFRNPLATLSSMIESFFDGKLGDYRHKIDIYKGPIVLASGYKTLQHKSISIQYEKLIEQPEETIKYLCKYLSIPYISSLIKDFNRISLNGRMGDSIGTKKYQKLEKAPLEHWKQVFGTRYRKAYGLRYMKYLGRETLSTFGYDFDNIIYELSCIKSAKTGGIRDRYDLFLCNVKTLLEIPLLKKKIKDKLRFEKKFYIHF